MKKLLILALAISAFSLSANAQSRALGIRGAYGIEASYQCTTFGDNFLEADLGWYPGSIAAAVCHDFVWDISSNFNLYAGPGANVHLFSTRDNNDKSFTAIGAGVGVQLGVELEIPFAPINISIDWRPMWNFIGPDTFMLKSAALGIRYRF